ncbi:MAG TPA: hypothetical protein VM029_11625 [Opitutaceae bacterium]|nr:hypothetical protein [Opitutaceae bacterium]
MQNGVDKDDPRNLSLAIDSRGFVALSDRENPHDSVTGTLKLEGGAWTPMRRQPPAGPAPRIGDATETSIGGVLSKVTTPWYIFPSVDGVFESTQHIRHFNVGVGASLAFNTSVLNRVFDLVPSFLRYGPNAARNNPRMLDVAFSYRYVRQHFKTALFPTDEKVSRGEVNVEWETGIFSDQRLAFRYNGYYLPGSKTERYVDFAVVRIDLLRVPVALSQGAVSIKYTTGRLPPLYQAGQSLGAGFSVDF